MSDDKPSVVEFRPDAKRAADVIRHLRGEVRSLGPYHGSTLVGYALVTWDIQGDVRTAVLCNGAPINVALVPTLAQSSLTVHVAALVGHKLRLTT